MKMKIDIKDVAKLLYWASIWEHSTAQGENTYKRLKRDYEKLAKMQRTRKKRGLRPL